MKNQEGGDIVRNRYLSMAWEADGMLEHRTSDGEVIYSPQYSDDKYVYRHIHTPRIVMKRAIKMLALKNQCRNEKADQRAINDINDALLDYDEIVTQLYLHMSPDWKLYMIHERDSTFCFRRPRRD